MRKLLLLTLLVGVGVSSAWGQPEDILQYCFDDNGNTVEPTMEATGVTGSNFQISAGSVGFGSAQSGTWLGCGVPYAQGSGGWTAEEPGIGKHFFFSMDADPGVTFSITEIRFWHRATGAGPSALAVYVNGELVRDISVADSETVHEVIDVSGFDFDDLEEVSVEIHGYRDGSRTTGGGGDFRLNEVTLVGTVEGVQGPEITHTPLGNTTSTDARTAVATITGNDLITVGDDRPVLWYRVDGGGWNSTYFTNQTDDDFEFTIPGQAASSTVEYYIAARDEDDVTTHPPGGSGTEPPGSTPPETFHSYTVEMVATHLAFVDFPGMGFTDEPVATFTVEARRDDDAADPNYTDNVTLTKQSGPGNVTGTLIVAAVDGVATFDDVAFDEAGTYTLVATAPDVDPDVSSEIEIQVAPEPPVIIAYWNFNDESLDVTAGSGTMTSTVEPENYFAGSSVNAAFGSLSGMAFSPRGESDLVNNGAQIEWAVSTEGFDGIVVSWAHQRTGTGFNNNTFEYSSDGGGSWTTFESGIDPPTSFARKEFDLRDVAALDDNPDVRFRLTLDGATATAGNNRYDNVRISGSPIVEEEDEQFVDSPGEYDFAGTDVSMNFTESGTEGDVTVKLFGTGTAGRAPEGVLTFSSNRFWRITSDKTGFTTDVTFTLDPGEDEFDPSEFADEDVVMLHRANADDQWEKWPRDNTEWNTEGVPPTFEITAQSVMDFSEWVVGIAETALPIDLASFDAAVDGRDALLTWQTASETNNAGFHIQRRSGEGFADVGFVEGRGTDPEGRAYSYRVEDLSPGTHSFRLRQVDFDGGVSYSSVLEVSVELAEAYELTAAYPNPFNPQTSFKLTVAQEQHVTIEVYDVLGRRVATLHDGLMPAYETQTFTFSGGSLSSGLYLYRVEGETFSRTRRMTLLK